MYRQTSRLFALFAFAASVVGCASSPPPAPAPPPPPATLSQIKADLQSAKTQMSMTTGALNALAKSTSSDVQANYNRFSRERAELEVMVDSNRARVADLKVRSKQYFDTWNNEAAVGNPDLQRRLAQQRADAEKTYSTIKSEMEMAKLAFNPYMANLKDVQSFLKTDPSPARISTASDLIAKINEDGKNVEQHIDAVLAEIDKMMANNPK
jgi:hypothetical protein